MGGDGGIGEGRICDNLCEEVTCLGDKGDVRVRGWRSGLQVWEELRAGAEDGQGVRVAGKKGGAGSGGGVNEAQALAGGGEEELERGGWRCQREARRRWFGRVLVRV